MHDNSNQLKDYQAKFIQFALSRGVLSFGEYTLKSGRVSPYFFNAGGFNDGDALNHLSYFYAQAIIDADLSFDLLFGPAYKGIPLAATTALQLASQFNCNKPYAFNRKEAKDHGEGGQIVGAPLAGRVLIIDDVITAGTAIKQSLALMANLEAIPAGVVVALDRQERGDSERSAIQELEIEYGLPVVSIIGLDHLLAYLKQTGDYSEHYGRVAEYRQTYGVDLSESR